VPPEFREETSCSRQSHAALRYKAMPWTCVKVAVETFIDRSAEVDMK
jgi:hypothetical protein